MASRLGSKPFLNTSKDMKSAIEGKCREILTTALALEENRYCFDCGSKGPRWASWNLGVFLCIRCAGFHRKMGVHISKVKSVDLDSWTPDQVSCVEQMGNRLARDCYEAKLDSSSFRRPQTDTGLEAFIREKYEHMKYARPGFQPPRAAERIEWLEDLIAGKTGGKKKFGSSSQVLIPAIAKPPEFGKSTAAGAAAVTGTGPSGAGAGFTKEGGDASGGWGGFHSATTPVTATHEDLLGLDVVSETPASPQLSAKNDLATLLGGDLVMPATQSNSGQMTNESIMSLYGSSQQSVPVRPDLQWGLFGN